MTDYLGLLPILILFLAYWAWTDIWRSKRSTRVRLIWCAIAAIPVLGFLAWAFAGPRAA